MSRKTKTTTTEASKREIVLSYKATDGASKSAKFATIKGAQAFAHKWVGATPELAHSYAVSGDGVGRITWKGCSPAELWPQAAADREAEAQALASSATASDPAPAPVISDAAAALPASAASTSEDNPHAQQPGESRAAYRRRVEAAMVKLLPWLPAGEAAVVGGSTEFAEIILRTVATIEGMPTSYSTEGQGDDAVAVLHYFHGGASDWFLTERDAEGDGRAQCFGLAILNGDTDCAELGYVNVAELVACGAELDLHFEPKPMREIRRIKGVRPLNGDAQQTQGDDTPTAAEIGAAVRQGVQQASAEAAAGAVDADRSDEDDADDDAPVVDSAAEPDEKAEALPPVQTIKAMAVNQLQAALQCSAVGDVRYYMNTVFLCRDAQGAGRIVSSDGHRMLVQAFDAPDGIEWISEQGVLLSAPELKEACAILAKHGEAFALDWAPGHTYATLRAADGFASLRVPVVEGKYPEWQRIVAGVDLSNAGGEAMDAATINAEYLKSAATVAKALGAKGLQAFATSPTKPTTFLFAGAGGAVLIIMPVRSESPIGHLTETTARIVGAAGLSSTVAALKAHETRTLRAIKRAEGEGAPAKQLDDLRDRLAGFRDRIAKVVAMTAAALPAPAKA